MSSPPAPPSSEIPPEAIQSDVEPRGFRLTDIDLRLRESQTARHIAITLVVILAVTLIANFVTLIVLTVYNRLDAGPSFDKMFAVWIPLLSGLVGSAVTFYFTKEKK